MPQPLREVAAVLQVGDGAQRRELAPTASQPLTRRAGRAPETFSESSNHTAYPFFTFFLSLKKNFLEIVGLKSLELMQGYISCTN